MRTKTITLIIFLSLFIIQTAQAQTKSNAIDTVVERVMKESGIVGMGAAIIIDKKVVWSKGYGFANQENKTPFTSSTVMNIASISKTFTGVCIMKAVEEGRVSLDEDINAYLPFKVVNPNFPSEKITLRQLATHTSSLADRYPFYEDSTYFYNGRKPEGLGEFLKNYFIPGGKHYSKENFLAYKPGTYREYSNIAAGLAGYIVELRTGKKLSAYGRTHIFKPLNMTATGWSLAKVDVSKHSTLYEKKDGQVVPISLYEGTTYPDGGVRTTVNELATFFNCLLNNGEFNKTRILKKETVDEMIRFQFTESSKPQNVKPDKLNSGIFWATKMGGTRMGHNGSDPGVRTFMLTDLSKEIGIVLFFNTALSEAEEGTYFDLYEKFYQYAATLRKSK